MSESTIDRRSLLKTAGAAAVGFSAIAQAAAGRRKYVNVGVGSRSRMYLTAITKTFAKDNELVAVCDTNPGRMDTARKFRCAQWRQAPKKYLAADFDKMLKETKPDCVIVTCPDAFHDEYIVRALDAGCDGITEKPMTTTAEKAQRIVDACKRNNRHVRVLFNYRYSPPRTQVKDLLMSGDIGDVLSVDFHWLLNTLHGADYFRRWHSQKKISGGLMVHKATHHFDLVNWWLGSDARIVHGLRQARVLHADDGEAHGPAEPPRALPHLPGEGQVHLLPGPRAPTRTSRSCTSTTRSTTAISAIGACSGRTSTSKTR